jgi:hypothetical protein
MFNFDKTIFYRNLSNVNKIKVDNLSRELKEIFENENENIVIQTHFFKKNQVHNFPVALKEYPFDPLYLHFSHAKYFTRRYIFTMIEENILFDFKLFLDFLKDWKKNRKIVLYLTPYYWLSTRHDIKTEGNLSYNFCYMFKKDSIIYNIPEDVILIDFFKHIAYHRYGYYKYIM